MATLERLMTQADLRALEAQPGNEAKRYELVQGVISQVPYPSPTHNLLVGNIYTPLRAFVKAAAFGYVFSDSVSYRLPNGDEIAPDVSFVSFARQAPPPPKVWEIAPDIAVEIESPSNREREMQNTVKSLLQSGTRFVWVVYPSHQWVDVWRINTEGDVIVRKVTVEGMLDGEDVLTGFHMHVKDIFDLSCPQSPAALKRVLACSTYSSD